MVEYCFYRMKENEYKKNVQELMDHLDDHVILDTHHPDIHYTILDHINSNSIMLIKERINRSQITLLMLAGFY